MNHLYEKLPPREAIEAENRLYELTRTHLEGYKGGLWDEWHPETGVVVYLPPSQTLWIWEHADHGPCNLGNRIAAGVVATLFCWSHSNCCGDEYVALMDWVARTDKLTPANRIAIAEAID